MKLERKPEHCHAQKAVDVKFSVRSQMKTPFLIMKALSFYENTLRCQEKNDPFVGENRRAERKNSKGTHRTRHLTGASFETI
jgi:hypothetical protein